MLRLIQLSILKNEIKILKLEFRFPDFSFQEAKKHDLFYLFTKILKSLS